MKKDIHPNYTAAATISCACGETYTIGSTMPEMQTELCAKCHPFYTGKQKIIDTARRVEKFEKRAAAKADAATGKKAKAAKRRAQKIAKREEQEKADMETK
jgi:large subunit ribosomal protein L31